MSPYYQDQFVTLYHADARDVLPLVDASSIGLVLTDPPYGIALANHDPGGRRRAGSFAIKGDECGSIGAEVLAWCEERAIPTISFASAMKPWSGRWRQHLVWDKGPAVGGGGDPDRLWKQSWELIQVARTGVLSGKRECAVLNFWVTPQDSVFHPAQKPLELLSYLIRKACAPDGAVVDWFVGSGSTLVAAKILGRHSIGVEIDERHCETAAQRCRQGVLFPAAS